MNKYNHRGTVRINLDNVKIGGGAYAALKEAETKEKQKKAIVEQSESKPYTNYSERDKYLNAIKSDLMNTHYWWMMIYLHYDDYKFSEQDYYEIARFAIDLYPDQMDRVLVDKLTPNHYYEICDVMARRGFFNSVDYEKLKRADVNNPVLNIMITAYKESGKLAKSTKATRSQQNVLDFAKKHGIFNSFDTTFVKLIRQYE